MRLDRPLQVRLFAVWCVLFGVNATNQAAHRGRKTARRPFDHALTFARHRQRRACALK